METVSGNNRNSYNQVRWECWKKICMGKELDSLHTKVSTTFRTRSLTLISNSVSSKEVSRRRSDSIMDLKSGKTLLDDKDPYGEFQKQFQELKILFTDTLKSKPDDVFVLIEQKSTGINDRVTPQRVTPFQMKYSSILENLKQIALKDASKERKLELANTDVSTFMNGVDGFFSRATNEESKKNRQGQYKSEKEYERYLLEPIHAIRSVNYDDIRWTCWKTICGEKGIDVLKKKISNILCGKFKSVFKPNFRGASKEKLNSIEDSRIIRESPGNQNPCVEFQTQFNKLVVFLQGTLTNRPEDVFSLVKKTIIRGSDEVEEQKIACQIAYMSIFANLSQITSDNESEKSKIALANAHVIAFIRGVDRFLSRATNEEKRKNNIGQSRSSEDYEKYLLEPIQAIQYPTKNDIGTEKTRVKKVSSH